MKHHKWTPEEDKYLLSNYKGNIDGLAERFGVQRATIIARHGRLLKGNVVLYKEYSAEDESYIIENWQVKSTAEIGNYFGVSTSAIYKKVHEMRKNGAPLPLKKSGAPKGVIRTRKPPKIKPVKAPKEVSKNTRQFLSKPFDPTGKVLVQKDHKTWVYKKIA